MRRRWLSTVVLLMSLVILAHLPAALPRGRAAAPAAATATVSGTVLLPGGQPASGAQVSLILYAGGGIDIVSIDTGPSGTFSLTMDAGSYRLRITPPAGQSSAFILDDVPVEITGASPTMDLGVLTLPAATRHIQGVVNRDGAPLAGATVTATNYAPALEQVISAVTGAAGSFDLGVSDGTWQVQVAVPSDEPWMPTAPPQVLTFRSGSPATQSVTLSVAATTASLVGRVVSADGSNLDAPSDVRVNVYSLASQIWRRATLSATGAFTVPLLAGRYRVTVEVSGASQDTYDSPPEREIDVGVGRVDLGAIPLPQRNAGIAGTVKDNQGAPVGGALVQAYGAGGGYWSTTTDSGGSYTLRVSAGEWEVYASARAQGLANVPPQTVVATANATATADFTLPRRDARIIGAVKDGSGQAVGGVEVSAFGQGNSNVQTTTSPDGSYELLVATGEQHVYVNADPARGLLDDDAYQIVTATSDAPVTLDFVLEAAAAQLSGSFMDPQGNPVGDVQGWAYARDAATRRYVAFSQVQQGGFTLNVPAGDLRVGVQLASGSAYSFLAESPAAMAAARRTTDSALPPSALDAIERAPYEQAIHVTPAGGELALAVKPVKLTLVRNSARIKGVLRDSSGQPVTGISGSVLLTPAGANTAWQQADLNPSDGSFDLGVADGPWSLSFYLKDSGQMYSSHPAAPITVSVAAGQTLIQDLQVLTLDGIIRGRVIDEVNRQPVTGATVFVWSNDVSENTRSDAQGNFSILVPLSRGGQRATYTVGAAFNCAPGDTCYLSDDPQQVSAEPRSLVAARQQLNLVELLARAANGLVSVSGKVTLNNRPQGGASVDVRHNVANGQRAQTVYTGSNGAFRADLSVRSLPSGNLPLNLRITRVIGRSVYKIDTNRAIPVRRSSAAALAENEVPAEFGDLSLREVATLPESVSETFAVADGWGRILADGTTIQIPPGAVPLRTTGETRARVVVEAVGALSSSNLYEPAAHYGYRISLFEAGSDRPISDPLRAPVLLTLRYSEESLWQNNAREEWLQPAVLSGEQWVAAGSHIDSPEANSITVQTTTLGAWALVRPGSAGCGSCVYLPLVSR